MHGKAAGMSSASSPCLGGFCACYLMSFDKIARVAARNAASVTERLTKTRFRRQKQGYGRFCFNLN